MSRTRETVTESAARGGRTSSRLRGPRLLAACVAAVVAAGIIAVAAVGPGTPVPATAVPGSSSTPVAVVPRTLTAAGAGRAFLSGYVREGRVVRTDQGGDTVSEGQAYAMLVAVGVGDRATFTAVWDWTRTHLLRPDGLISWRFTGDAVADPSSAADADLDAARALVLAGTAFADPGLTAQGIALGAAVLDHETVVTQRGRILLAGQWAGTDPYAYNPSYASPAAAAVLLRASGDPRWTELNAGTEAVTAALLTTAALPPDWAQVHGDGRVEAMPGVAGRGESVRYGYDAARTPVRLAESCDPAGRALAARMNAPLAGAGSAAELDLGGTPLREGDSVVAAVGHAATAAAAGDTDGAQRALTEADALHQRSPSYYGGAWDALGRLLLTGTTLGGCPPA
jgi:endoglucanase